jgi:uroporphyrinogen III methyltransferase / synthase
MTDTQSLAGKRIVVTRALKQAREFARQLEEKGAEVLMLPLVRFSFPDRSDVERLNKALRDLANFDAILFLSGNAVTCTCQLSQNLRVIGELRDSSEHFIAAVGSATAKELEHFGLRVDYVAKGGTAESLARELGTALAGRKVLLPRSNLGDARLSDALRASAAEVTEVVAYVTDLPEAPDQTVLDRIRRGDVDVLTFASPSAFNNLCRFIDVQELAKLAARMPFATIGPTTAGAIRKAGIPVDIQATQSSTEGLVDAIASYFQGSSAAVRRL